MLYLKEYTNLNSYKLSDIIKSVAEFISSISTCETQTVIVDCSSVNSVHPVFAIALKIITSAMSKTINYINETENLKNLYFSDGLIIKSADDNLLNVLKNNIGNKHIPLIVFPALENDATVKDLIISNIESFMKDNFQIDNNVFYGIKYINGEITDNITEHSKSDYGYMMGFYNSEKGHLDICIADQGISVFQSYLNANYELEDDVEALSTLNKCISTKNRPDAENRGYGIKTSKDMLINGLDGQFLMLSGKCLYLYDKNTDCYLSMERMINWKGTIIGYRIPIKKDGFTYSSYI